MRLIKLEAPTSNMYCASYVAFEAIRVVNVEKSGLLKKVWLEVEGGGRYLWYTSDKKEDEVLREVEERLGERVRNTKTF